MSIWAHRVCKATDDEICDCAQVAFADLFKAIGSPSTMLLLRLDTERDTQLVAQLPHAALLPALPGFSRLDPSNVPLTGELVVGWEDSFESQFRVQPAPAY